MGLALTVVADWLVVAAVLGLFARFLSRDQRWLGAASADERKPRQRLANGD